MVKKIAAAAAGAFVFAVIAIGILSPPPPLKLPA